MKRRMLLLVIAFMLVMPFASSSSGGNSFIALAGHSLSGQYCDCGCLGCMCDPGDILAPCPNSATHPGGDKGKSGSDGMDMASSAGLGILALLLILSRMRA